MKTLRLLAFLTCPLALLLSSLRPSSPWTVGLAVLVMICTIASVLVWLRDKRGRNPESIQP
jgi:hypothetical protein